MLAFVVGMKFSDKHGIWYYHANIQEKPVVSPTAPTQERGKEMALIACIMTHNFFDAMVADPSNAGVMACYDLIASWSSEFYDQYKDFDWENMVHRNGDQCKWPNANGWEDVVVLFTQEKINAR